MILKFHAWRSTVFSVIVCLQFGCASTSNPLTGETASLPLIPGETSLEIGKINVNNLVLPESAQLSTGSVLMFSPIEFRSDKDRFSIDSVTMPIGRYVAVRHSSEGILADLQNGEARSFELHYDAHYPDITSAQRDFPNLANDKYRHVTAAGKPVIEIEQWHLRTTMIFSKERQAFRVLLDNISYTAPQPQVQQSEETPIQNKSVSLPIIVAFSYRHPDASTEQTIQQNIIYEFKASSTENGYNGQSQVSGWVPLHALAQTQPYTVGIVLVEVHEKGEAFYKKLYDFAKNVRGLM